MFKSQKDLLQTLIEGKRIRKDVWWPHCYLYMDEDGMIYDEEEHQYNLNITEYASFREVKPTDYKFMKYLTEIKVDKLSCVFENINCIDCALYVENECVKADLIEHIEECQKLLGGN